MGPRVMVAYSFKARFVGAILEGSKVGTIRAEGRRRHAIPGEELQLYTGMRTRSCRLIARATCSSVDHIRLDFGSRGEPVRLNGDAWFRREGELDAFARGDGFRDWEDLRAFWAEAHGQPTFSGVWIRWEPGSVIRA